MRQNILAVTLIAIIGMLVLTGPASSGTLKEVIQLALESGDTTSALAHLQREIEVDPTYHYNYHVLGMIHYNRGEYSQARDYLEIAVDKKKKYYESRQYLGLSYLELGDIDAAEKAFSEGLKKARDLKDTFEYCMALVMIVREDYDGADRSLRRAIAIDSTVSEYHIALGNVNFYQGIPALAINSYETALALDTASTEVYFRWAEACLEMRNYNCAIDKLRIVLSKDSTFAEAWNRAGGIYYKAARSTPRQNREQRVERYRDVIGSYERYVELNGVQPDSSSVRVFHETAMSYYNIRRYEEAAKYFDLVLSIPYEPRDIYFYLGKSLWGTRDYGRCSKVLHQHKEWVTQQDENYESRINQAEFNKLLGDAYFYQKPKDYYNASKYYQRSINERPDQARLLRNLAVSYHQQDRYGEALTYYDLRIAKGVDSSSANIFKNAFRCALQIAGGNGVEEELDDEDEEVADETSIDPNVNYNEVAINYMNGYLEFDPNDTAVVERIANTYLFEMHDCANGVAAFERLLVLDPNNCLANRSLGFAYFTGDYCTTDLRKTLRYLLAAYRCTNASEGPCDDELLVKSIGQAYHLCAVEADGDTNSD